MHLGIQQCFTDISLCINDMFLVGSHAEGNVTIVNLESDAVEIIEKPFGEVDNIWAAEVIPFRPDGEPQQLLMPSERGLFPCIVTEDGNFLYMMQSHFLDQNVTNCAVIDEDRVLCSIQEPNNEGRLVILNLDSFEEIVVIQPDVQMYILDITRFSSGDGVSNYFILHTGRGVKLVNVENAKCYDLANNSQGNFNVCRSIDTALIDPSDPD